MQIKTVWQEEMTFEVHQDGHRFLIDGAPEHGGRNLGPRPKALLLTALAGCTSMDVISILRKMRVPVEGLTVAVDGVLSEEHPKRFLSATVHYEVTGPADLSVKKVIRAIRLSDESYCGVSATLRPAMELSIRLTVNGEAVDLPQA